MLTQETAREIFRYDGLRGKLIWRAGVREGKDAGGVSSDGYMRVKVRGKYRRAHRVIWLYIHGYLPEHGLDHINRDRVDNRIENLREVSNQCNIRNSGNQSRNVSGVKGVSYERKRNTWRATICVMNKTKSLGNNPDFREAVALRLAAEQCIGWADCDNRSPAFNYMEKHLRSKP